jgi:hypothetical protein
LENAPEDARSFFKQNIVDNTLGNTHGLSLKARISVPAQIAIFAFARISSNFDLKVAQNFRARQSELPA